MFFLTKKSTSIVAGLAIIITGTLLSSCSEEGSYWNSKTTQLHNDKVGRLEAVGEDLRVYEFTPQTNKNIQCVFVAGTSKGGLFCFNK